MFDDSIALIKDLFACEQKKGPIQGIDDVQARRGQRVQIQEQLHTLEAALSKLRTQIGTLPALPPDAPIHWARSVRAMPNLVFLEVDTTGLYGDAEIIRVAILSGTGQILLDRYVWPVHAISAKIAEITGITNDQLRTMGAPLAEVIAQVKTALLGRYLLSYNLDFDRGKLREATERLKVEDIQIIGDDLMPHAMRYFTLTAYPKLETLCERVGAPLVRMPHQTALDRARGQIALLHAIADVVTGPPTKGADTLQDEMLDDLDDDEHPF